MCMIALPIVIDVVFEAAHDTRIAASAP